MKPSADVLALGKTIVQELTLDPGVDTLGRWMAHYIAELIHDAEQASEDHTRREKQGLAAEAIAKLWAHRSQYQNRINPLTELKPVIQVLRSLDPNQNIWIRHFSQANGKAEAIRHLYDAFRRLMVYMLISKLPESADLTAATERASATSTFQDKQEMEIVASLDHWLSEREVAALSSPPDPQKRTDTEQEDSRQSYVEALLSDAREALDLVAADLTPPSDTIAMRRGRSKRK